MHLMPKIEALGRRCVWALSKMMTKSNADCHACYTQTRVSHAIASLDPQILFHPKLIAFYTSFNFIVFNSRFSIDQSYWKLAFRFQTKWTKWKSNIPKINILVYKIIRPHSSTHVCPNKILPKNFSWNFTNKRKNKAPKRFLKKFFPFWFRIFIWEKKLSNLFI